MVKIYIRKKLRTLNLRILNLIIVGYSLLNFNFSTSSLKSSLQCVSSSLVNTFLNVAWSSVYEVLSFLKSKTARFLNSLYYLKFSSTSALENNIE